MLKDRGNKKWTGLMLTEHRKALRKIWEHRNDIDKPVLDEQQLERLDILIKEAIRDQFKVKMVYYDQRRLYELEGKVSIKGSSLYLDNKSLDKDNIIDLVLI
ncbi:YolD-like family protein [Iocasia frigidifontis]|uniref:YolD-like family protein n=1 Tax=Iocasia fonsfrigidae TaxID=2682810 RepID=A0A8A7K7I2_9FIRM|nr:MULTISPECIES: YolD-like family protein [Halanaerobiaceae]AZO94453.1 YolD-like family protein [Halocella sp. SP3-1]QTL97391.1 YolD-like family protein [Iocasia fonsfrigidae]